VKTKRASPTHQLLVIVFYLAGMQLAVLFEPLPGSVVPVWPSAGVSFAAVLVMGWRIWPALVIGPILGQWLLDPIGPVPFACVVLANVLGPLAAWRFIRMTSRVIVFEINVRNGFLLLSAAICHAVVSATLGTLGLFYGGIVTIDGLPVGWTQWWLGDVFAIMVCGPAMMHAGALLIRHPHTWKNRQIASVGEKLVWIAALLATGVAFLKIPEYAPRYASAILFCPLALLIWSAMRFPPAYTLFGVMIVNLTMIALAGLGLAGFPVPVTVLETSILLMFLCVLSIVPLLIAGSTQERRAYAKRLAWRADHDRLTGLLNRTAFEESCNEIMKEAKKQGEPLALCYLDLDQFKVVNDTCGHAVGDDLIAQVACVLERHITEGDVLARLGGDELGVLLRHCPASEAETRADRLRTAIEGSRFTREGRLFAFTVSIGVVVVKDDDFNRLLSLADTACYTAKELGRNRVKLTLSEDIHIAVNRTHMAWYVRINEAIEHDRFRLFFQSIVPLETEPASLHFEILLRMIDEDGKLLPPGVFIPAAERFHLMTKVDRWVVGTTLRWLRHNPEVSARTSICSINLSGPSVGDEAFGQLVVDAFAETEVPPEKICFEITETAAISDLSHATHFIDEMRALGCHFALDDFGSGLAGFSYLKALDVDFLKIDGAFVREIVDAPVDHAMVKAINEVGQIMGKQTIAEYVENETINDKLRALGVDYAQGYAVDKPRPIDSLIELITAVSPNRTRSLSDQT